MINNNFYDKKVTAHQEDDSSGQHSKYISVLKIGRINKDKISSTDNHQNDDSTYVVNVVYPSFHCTNTCHFFFNTKSDIIL